MSRFPSDRVPASVPEVPETEIPSAFSERLRRKMSYVEHSYLQSFKSQEIGARPMSDNNLGVSSPPGRQEKNPPWSRRWQGPLQIFLETSPLFLRLLLAHPLSLQMARASLPDTIHAVLLTEIGYRIRGRRRIRLES